MKRISRIHREAGCTLLTESLLHSIHAGGAVSNRRLLFGLSRTRDRAGWIEHFNLRDVTNTIHAQVGAVRLNMEVLIAEFYESDTASGED